MFITGLQNYHSMILNIQALSEFYMTRYEEIEAALASIAEDLSRIKEKQEGQRDFIEKVLEDRLPHTPLVKLYKRPAYSPYDC